VSINNTSLFSCDRWQTRIVGGGVVSAQRSTIVPSGFTNSQSLTVTTADASIASTDDYKVGQFIEGFNSADLGWGAAGAQAVTLSFWVRSSVTGTYAVSLQNNAENRSYPATYAISAANTWEQKTITVPGDTSGTWLTDTGIGVRVTWNLGSGSSFNGTANAWNAADSRNVSGQTNWIATSGATFYITGVQLEAGSVATPFERRDYGRELIMCQRYYTTVSSGGRQMYRNHGFDIATARDVKTFPVSMRATPTLVVSGSTVDIDNGTAVSGASVAGFANSERLITSYLTYTSQPAGGVIHNAVFSATASAEL
jgi:hypothetical protein